jgi:bifunctional enzyme CysN/CysC
MTGGLDPAASSTMLRLSTAGSVDDGKSTLIGRLLLDTKNILADQLAHVEEASRRRGDAYTDLALLTDGLRAEREQGITIDVAYRYFTTARRKFIIADTPGHVQYTRNMVTGASTADLAIVLIDARKGVLEQTRRHAFIASLLRVPHLVVAVNKMDLVDYDRAVFEAISEEFADFASKLEITDVTFLPMSALEGTSSPAPPTCPGSRAPRSCTTSSTSTSPPIATSSTRASRCSGSSARTAARRSGATRARWPAASCAQATT